MEPAIPTFPVIPGALPAGAVARQLAETLEDLPGILKPAEPALRDGTTLGELRGLTSQDYAALYATACDLCDADRFRDALPIAVQLAAHEPRDKRFAFIAGSCLQRLGMFKPASAMFGLCILGETDLVALYRLGECLAALGEKEQAREAFESAYEMCRGDDDRHALQDDCASALARLARTEFAQ